MKKYLAHKILFHQHKFKQKNNHIYYNNEKKYFIHPLETSVKSIVSIIRIILNFEFSLLNSNLLISLHLPLIHNAKQNVDKIL